MKSRPAALAAALTTVIAVLLTGATAPAGAATLVNATTASPSGANNWSCVPTAAKPYPVVLTHGTYGDMKSLFDPLSASLKSAGYCVYAFNYGYYGTRSMATSAGELKTFVDAVLADTGAAKVNIVGHSQGGTMPRYYIKNLAGAAKVNDLVGIAPANHGTTWTGLTTLFPGFYCTACHQLLWGSSFLKTLNATDETPGDVSYTTITTAVDKVVTPYTSGYLAGPNTTNVRLQDVCPANVVDHVNAPKNVVVIRWALNALATPGPASPTYRPACS
jgi:triacylglycerol lipase